MFPDLGWLGLLFVYAMLATAAAAAVVVVLRWMRGKLDGRLDAGDRGDHGEPRHGLRGRDRRR